MALPHRHTRWFAAFLVLLLSVAPAGAQRRLDAPKLDSLFDVLEANDRMMGSVTVREGGRVVYRRALGFREVRDTGGVRSDSDTMFRIGSITKVFTAVMVHQLVEEGRLAYDTRLSAFFPRVAGADSITVARLLGHSTGLPDYAAGLDGRPRTREEILARIAGLPSEFAPGTRRRYSNTNYTLLGFIVEEVTGSTYAEQLERRISGRIGLRRTRYGGAVEPARNEARSHFWEGGGWLPAPEEDLSAAAGAGAVVSTTSDLTLFASALFGGRLLSARGLREMTTPLPGNLSPNGKGIGVFTPVAGKRGHSHDGGVGEFAALLGHVPEDSLSVALTVNGHNYPINRVFFAVWGILYGAPVEIPSFTPVRLPAAALAPFEGTYASESFGITIRVTRSGEGLVAQTVGQDPFPLVAVGPARFTHAPDGILVEFAEAPGGGPAPRFTLFQRRFAIVLTRKEP